MTESLVLYVPTRCSWELEKGKAPFLSPCALGRQVEQLQGRAQLLMDGELLLHLDVADAIGERRDDGLLDHLGNLEASAVDALDVLLQGLSWLLLDVAQVAHGRGPVASALEVGDEAGAHLVPGGDRARRQVQEPGAGTVLECHGKPIRHDLLVPVGGFDAQLIELEELCRVSRAIVARGQIWLELAGQATLRSSAVNVGNMP